MAVYLQEDMIGSDPAQICYPHLLLCMGTTALMSDGSLIGAHVTDGATEGAVLSALLRAILTRGTGTNPATMVALYLTGDWQKHLLHDGKTLQAKAATLSFHGDVYSFDTGTIGPRDGTFVEVTSNGPAAVAGIRYKQNDKMAPHYTGGGAVPVVTKIVHKDVYGTDGLVAASKLTPVQAQSWTTGNSLDPAKLKIPLQVQHVVV